MTYKTTREISNQPIHSEVCNATRYEAIKERGKYFERWPNHCQDCNGMGGIIGAGSDMRPSSLEVKGSVECGVCLMHAKCPRCAGRMPGVRKYDGDHDRYIGWLLDKNLSCPHCGWNWCKGEHDGATLIPDCTEDCMFYGMSPWRGLTT